MALFKKEKKGSKKRFVLVPLTNEGEVFSEFSKDGLFTQYIIREGIDVASSYAHSGVNILIEDKVYAFDERLVFHMKQIYMMQLSELKNLKKLL